MAGTTLIILIAVAVLAATASWLLAPAFWASILIAAWRRRAGLTSQLIDIEGVRWHYLRGGNGPLLLLLHGFGADSSCWLRLAPLLGPRFSLLIPDLPGFGESERPESLNFAIGTQATRLSRFLDALGVDQCMIAGNSMGGYLAMELAALEPRRVLALWLLAPLGVKGVPPGPLLEAIDSGDLEFLQITSLRQFRERVVPAMFSTAPWIPGPLAHNMAGTMISMRNVAPRMLNEVRFESEPLETIARRVDRPALLHWGRNDQVVNPAGLPVLEAALKDASSLLTENCGHLPMLEKPSESAQGFLEFLDEKGLG